MSTPTAPSPCLYCDKPATSREHILSSGIGGHLVDSTLICETHNNRAGEFADVPLANRFAYAVHCLDVLKGDGTRGTTWHELPLSDGTTLDIRPDRETRVKTIIERDERGLPMHIIGTEPKVFKKIAHDLARLPTPPVLASRTETIRDDILTPTILTGGDSLRGVSKAAVHFGAHLAADRASARIVAASLVPIIFSDTDHVEVIRWAPYSVEDRKRGHEFHELSIWPGDGGALVLVTLFNVVHCLVRLGGLIGIEPYRYFQSTRDGKSSIERIEISTLGWDDCFDDMDAEMKAELDWRIDQVLEVGRCKAEIVKLMEAEKRVAEFAALSPDAQRRALWKAASAFKPAKPITSRTCDAAVWFTKSRIFEATPQATWLPEH